MDWGKKWLFDFSAVKTQLVSFDRSNNNASIDMKINASVLEEKSSSKMVWLTFSSKLDWGSYIISITLIRSMKFLSPEVVLYLCKSALCPCMEYCCHVLADVPSCYWELLEKLLKQIWRTVGDSLAASIEPMAHHRNVASLSLFYWYLVDVLQNWLNWFHFLFLEGGLLVILIDCMIFCHHSYKDVYVNSFFPRTARLWNSLPIECFPWIYDLSGLKSRINRRL